jgi:hypothetical protein
VPAPARPLPDGTAATTATPAPRPIRVRVALAPGRTRSSAPRSTSATRRHLQSRERPLLEPGEADGTTCSDGDAFTRAIAAKAARAPAGTRRSARRSDQCHVAGTCDPESGRLLATDRDRRHDVQRRQRVHHGRRLLRGELRQHAHPRLPSLRDGGGLHRTAPRARPTSAMPRRLRNQSQEGCIPCTNDRRLRGPQSLHDPGVRRGRQLSVHDDARLPAL